MQIELVPAIIEAPKAGPPRSPGVHVSNLIRGLGVQSGKLDKRYVDDLSLVEVGSDQFWAKLDPISKLKVSMGLAWEAHYLEELEDVTPHPGELELEGVYMTHDGESVDLVLAEYPEGGYSYAIAIHEVKLTYKSINTVNKRFEDGHVELLAGAWMWLMQCKAYCKAIGARIAWLHVLYVCGDYGYPLSPELHIYRIEFTQQEIDDAWVRLTGYMRERIALEREELMKDTTNAY